MNNKWKPLKTNGTNGNQTTSEEIKKGNLDLKSDGIHTEPN